MYESLVVILSAVVSYVSSLLRVFFKSSWARARDKTKPETLIYSSAYICILSGVAYSQSG
jgi:hypothetical protein